MRLAETRDLFASTLEFPTDRDTVVDRVGDATIEAPTGDDETIERILRRVDQTEYASVDELYDLLIASVGEQYIGRKFYDDRGATFGSDLDEVSF